VRRFVDTLKGRIVVAFVLFVALSHMGGLWLYSIRSEAAIELLHDALVAERIALSARAAEAQGRPDLHAKPLKSNGLDHDRITLIADATHDQGRGDLLKHLVSAFLDRNSDDGIDVQFLMHKAAPGIDRIIGFINAAAHLGEHHRIYTPISEIKHEGTIVARIALADGSTLTLTVPAMTATSFSMSNLGAAIAAVAFFIALASIWILNRWTQPLVHFAAAADRLGNDIRAPSLAVDGFYEMRIAARAFNRMQKRMQSLIDDQSAMAASIAHDLGTPVTRLRLRAEEIDDSRLKELVLGDIDQMHKMMSSTLEFSRLDSDSVRFEPFDLASLVDAVCSEFIDLGGDVSVEGPVRLPIESDPISVRRILSNLIDNAVRYGGTVNVKIESSGSSASILVDDNGPGIPEALRATALAPFRRLQMSNGNDRRGSGLGLAIANHLISRLGGTLSLLDSPHGGLRVAVWLPSVRKRED